MADDAQVREATEDDVPAMTAVLSSAFRDDPVVRWLLPDPARHPKMFDVLIRHTHLTHEGSEVTGRGEGIEAVALWDPPGQWRLPLTTQARRAPDFLRAFGSRLPAALRILTAMERHHPREPHWYLHFIGTDPAAQGTGLGSALLASRLDRCDAEGIPAYLESSNPANVPLYERHGFKITRDLALPGTCPPLQLMWRDPQPVT